MNPIQHLRRFAVVVAGLAAALVAFATPAFAVNYPLPIDPGTGSGTSTTPRRWSTPSSSAGCPAGRSP
jgi:hypothetical protein